jgi:hypothetical protein
MLQFLILMSIVPSLARRILIFANSKLTPPRNYCRLFLLLLNRMILAQGKLRLASLNGFLVGAGLGAVAYSADSALTASKD